MQLGVFIKMLHFLGLIFLLGYATAEASFSAKFLVAVNATWNGPDGYGFSDLFSHYMQK